jgi:putative membrane protein
MIQGGWWGKIIAGEANWLAVKLVLVLLLYGYHVSLQVIFQKMSQYQFPLSSMKLRIWNEVATVFLFAIVMLATVKESISFVWGLGGLALLVSLLLIAIKVYKRFR